jgi:subtilisin family serine protease
MAKVPVLIELDTTQPEAFTAHAAAIASPLESTRQAERAVQSVAELGVEIEPGFAPVPLFSQRAVDDRQTGGFAAFASPTPNPDVPASSVVVVANVDESRLPELRSRSGVRGIYNNSRLVLLEAGQLDESGGVECRPFRAPATVWEIRTALGVRVIWRDGFRGDDIVVGIIDEGVNGEIYPVIGGFARDDSLQPGAAPITSHGSMCAADVLVAAPGAKLYDYPFLGSPTSGGALTMFQAVLNQRRLDGTPHLTSNSYGFASVPPRESAPNHEIWDLNHPLHRKIREVIASGAPAFFAAGNCGANCPSGKCMPSSIGAGKSIHASNSLAEVISVAAVNGRGERLGYSSTGPGMFEHNKPDLAAYSHFTGNFGPGRPGGSDHSPFDNGTSAACPVAAGVGALLLSAFPATTPVQLKQALIDGAQAAAGGGWNADLGYGIVQAATTYGLLAERRSANKVAA